MLMTDIVLAIDAGTTGVRSMFFDKDGNVLGKAYSEYESTYPSPSWVEQDAELVIQKTFEACSDAVSASGVDAHKIISVGFSTQRATFCLLDDDMSVIGGNF